MRGLGAPDWAWARRAIAPNPCSSQRKFIQASAAPIRMPAPQRQVAVRATIMAAMTPKARVKTAMRCWTRWKRSETEEAVSIGDKIKIAGKMPALQIRASGPPRKPRRTLSYRIFRAVVLHKRHRVRRTRTTHASSKSPHATSAYGAPRCPTLLYTAQDVTDAGAEAYYAEKYH